MIFFPVIREPRTSKNQDLNESRALKSLKTSLTVVRAQVSKNVICTRKQGFNRHKSSTKDLHYRLHSRMPVRKGLSFAGNAKIQCSGVGKDTGYLSQRKPNDAMSPSCLIRTVQGSGQSIMILGMFCTRAALGETNRTCAWGGKF
ncbi:hypothetical protein TNCV_987411 [Trichonephila clavipes]|nr:hypothetical protein TNCV_987411 [Trichonephila clavipes]